MTDSPEMTLPAATDLRADQIATIADLPDRLRKAVADLNDAQLDTPYGAGKWTIRQVVHHLADSHLNAYIRMKLIVTEDNPTLKTYDQEAWAETAEAKSMPIETSLTIIDGLHERWCAFLNTLPPEAWDRRAMHPEIGTVGMTQIVDIYARHGESHVGQIRGLREEKGW